jgi:hypothetical protein
LSLPRSRVLSSLSSPSLWSLPIHGNDKTVTSRAISEVGTSHRPTSLCSSVASFTLHSRPGAVSHERPSRLVCRKSRTRYLFGPSVYSVQLCRTPVH